MANGEPMTGAKGVEKLVSSLNEMSKGMISVSYTHLDVYKRQAQKQPYIQRVRNSSLVERSCAENVRG